MKVGGQCTRLAHHSPNLMSAPQNSTACVSGLLNGRTINRTWGETMVVPQSV